MAASEPAISAATAKPAAGVRHVVQERIQAQPLHKRAVRRLRVLHLRAAATIAATATAATAALATTTATNYTATKPSASRATAIAASFASAASAASASTRFVSTSRFESGTRGHRHSHARGSHCLPRDAVSVSASRSCSYNYHHSGRSSAPDGP